jgi:hypothetical protein
MSPEESDDLLKIDCLSNPRKKRINILLPPVDKEATVHGVIFTSKVNELF